MTPFFLQFSRDNRSAPITRVTATSDPVPAGKLFVVEHISGAFTVGTGSLVDQIWAQDPAGQQTFLPTHFASRELNFGDALGIGVIHQFGSPTRMYVGAGNAISVNADSNIAGILQVCAVGHLIDT
jgi:hypothetical protein